QLANTTGLSNNSSKVSIYLQSSGVMTQKEIRWVYSAIGSFGGIWTLLAGIYSFAFGSTIIENFGRIFCKVKKQTRVRSDLSVAYR
ncbi:8207_t:CDS:2, partial [Gigaspora rosea]